MTTVTLETALEMLHDQGFIVKGLTTPEDWGAQCGIFSYYEHHYKPLFAELSKNGEGVIRFASEDFNKIFAPEN